MRGLVLVMVAVASTAAWPCSGAACSDEALLSTIDGGIPVNLQPLVLRRFWASPASASPDLGLYAADGGTLVAQGWFSTPGDYYVAASSPLTEGQYELQGPAVCGGARPERLRFSVTPAVDLSAPLVALHVANAGVAPVPQYSGSTCAEALPAAFAEFRVDVDAARADLLPFVRWSLALHPTDGGAPLAWSDEPTGTVLADGGLVYRPDLNVAPRRVLQAWHLCRGVDAGFPTQSGAPAGDYRAALAGTYPSGDAGFVAFSEAFTLADCTAEPSGGSGCSTTALGWPVLVVLLLNRRRASRR